MLEEERKKYSEELLREARYSISNIADILGYKESANYCRAFKSWFGISPSTYRRTLKR